YMLNEGVINGQPTLPAGWVGNATSVKQIAGEIVDYGYMWWPLDDGAYSAIGIFGQFVFVHPASRTVVALWGAQPKPVGTDVIDEYDFFNALIQELKPSQSSKIRD
ncbi:MAG: serine hydrolase, partial [Congregibacter sp.]|nr:serine hydrolase [Congregibacter sp.]